ncbi:hypothetical protein YQE_06306, partial [Dendroctonus ponderosae]
MKTGVFFATLWLFWLHLAWATKYEPNWKSLDKRPLPDWFDKAKIGIFLHWGVFSVPSFGSEWFWSEWQSNSSARINSYMKANYPPNFTYQDFAKDFSAEFFNSSQWADLFKRAGANYVVLTSKHHEGFTLWPSEYSFSWNAKDIGPHRDLLGDLGNAVKRAGLKFGVYHSLFEWFNPIYLADKRRNFTTQKFVDNKVLLEMKELVSNYKPWVIWSDGDWEADDTYWRSTDFLAWFGLYNESPVKDQVVVNDRWGRGTTCIHGDFINCHDRYNPGKLQRKKWENAMTLDRESWGFRRNADLSDYLTPHQLLTVLAQTISCGGNLLINLGPTKEGTIAPIFQDRLTQLGAWLRINGEAIYNSRPWIVQNDTVNPQVWYTSGNNAVYAIDLEWPLDNKVILGGAVSLFKSPDTAVSLLGNLGKLKWVMNSRRVEVHLPDKATAKSEGAWGKMWHSPLLLPLLLGVVGAEYQPTWESLDTRPLPSWFDEAKIGIFVHWGVYSVPSFDSEWFWKDWKTNSSEKISRFLEENFPPGFSYQEFARDFTAEFFNATQWADIFAKSGAKYVVLTSKHHEGFSLWPSKYTYRELGEAVRSANLTYGLYHSLFEWFHPLYLADQANNYTTQEFVTSKIIPELKELVLAYKPAILWSDGSKGASGSYWQSREFLAWTGWFPTIDGATKHRAHGDFYTCNDRYDPGVLQEKKWENAMTIDRDSWGYRRNARLADYLTPLDLLTALARTISCGGNLLINIGPSKEGTINPIFEERLTQLGNWLSLNGEAIYSSRPWTVQNDSVNPSVWYTTRDHVVYAITLEWPQEDRVILGSASELFGSLDTTVTLLGNNEELEWIWELDQIKVQLPNKAQVASETAWVLKIVAG